VSTQIDVDVMAYLELQGNTDMITKSDLIQAVRSHGEQISDRNLTYYASVGLIPPAVRIGARGGAYPKIVAGLVTWAVRCRRWGLSIEATRELASLWRLVKRGIRDGCIDLREFEYVARERVRLPEATRAVPLVLNDLVRGLCNDCRGKLTWLLKDGSTVSGSSTEQLVLTFVLGEIDPTSGRGVQVAWTQLRLPGIEAAALDDPCTVVVGIPNGVHMCRDATTRAVSMPTRQRPRQEEALSLA
jgi:DNA-binding transcriptional MerR regulator